MAAPVDDSLTAHAGTLLWILAAVATGHVFILWRAIDDRAFRSRVRALRDELRAAAINDPHLAASPLFDHLDKRLTCTAREACILSPFLALPLLWRRDLVREILRIAEHSTRTIAGSGIDAVQQISARVDAELYRFLWRRSPLAMLAMALAFSTGPGDLRAVAAACTSVPIDIRDDAGHG